jgi:diketogulonate reductase-like aldo/keto reductase
VTHAAANFAVGDFTLSEREMAEIAALGSPDGRIVRLGNVVPEWDPA